MQVVGSYRECEILSGHGANQQLTVHQEITFLNKRSSVWSEIDLVLAVGGLGRLECDCQSKFMPSRLDIATKQQPPCISAR